VLFYDTVLYRQQIVVIPKTEVALTDVMLLICSFNSPPQNSLELFIPVSNIILRHDIILCRSNISTNHKSGIKLASSHLPSKYCKVFFIRVYTVSNLKLKLRCLSAILQQPLKISLKVAAAAQLAC